MALVVPYDDSELAKAALVRARQFDTILEEGVVAVSVIPAQNTNYARKQDWIDDDEAFDGDQIVGHLEDTVEAIAPDARFEYILVDRWAPAGTIAKRLRRFARGEEASIVFIGSANAGRVVRSMSVGSTLSTDKAYDTMLISQPRPSKAEKLEAAVSTEEVLESS